MENTKASRWTWNWWSLIIPLVIVVIGVLVVRANNDERATQMRQDLDRATAAIETIREREVAAMEAMVEQFEASVALEQDFYANLSDDSALETASLALEIATANQEHLVDMLGILNQIRELTVGHIVPPLERHQ